MVKMMFTPNNDIENMGALMVLNWKERK